MILMEEQDQQTTMEENTTNRPYKGLHKDNSPQDQPEGTHRFGLNAIRETDQGDENFMSNEESNEECAVFPEGYIPIGKEYMTNGETAIMLCKEDDSLSEIGIVDDECNYVTHVRFDLGFRVSNQIDITYRKRRGCERTIYFTDDLNRPRIFNFDKPEDFKNSSGQWDADKFNLFKTYNKIPRFDNISLLETGQLLSGSYNFSVQYLDNDLNPTEWITTTDTVIIYNDDITSKPFSEIRGSTNKKTNYQDFGVTNKAIRLVVGNIDTDFPFYRIAAIEATNGGGRVSRVVFSQEISTRNNIYTYTGENAFTLGTEEEIQVFNNVIERAKNIEQIENKLTLTNTQGKQINYCALQKYASKITSDLVTQEIILNDIESINNQKRSQLHNEKIGYMPGEIYSFGIVYVFEDGGVSPVYHIPGRNKDRLSSMSFDNTLTDTLYTDNNNCEDGDYWGVDSQGSPLLDTNIRHHRFPLRSQVNKPLYVRNGSFEAPSTIVTNGLIVDVSGTIDPAFDQTSIVVYVNYNINGNAQEEQRFEITVASYDPLLGISDIVIDTALEGNIIDNIVITEEVVSGLVYSSEVREVDEITSVNDNSIYTSEIFGIKFSDIEPPALEDTNGEKVIGYYIVRNERDEENKTILDTGVLTPLLEETGDISGEIRFVAHGHLMPNSTRLKEDVFAVIHPEHKFLNKEYKNVTEYIQEGEYFLQSKNTASEVLQDVQPGTSYDSSAHRRRERDSDGFSLHVLNRNNNVEYVKTNSVFADSTEIVDAFYLNSLFSKSIVDINDNRRDIFNVSADNKIGILQLNKAVDITSKLPYVIMKRDLGNPYAGFRVLPYYKEFTNPSSFPLEGNAEISVFNGDSYISSMKYMSSMYYDIRMKNRDRKSGVFNFILAGLAILAGAILLATGVGGLAGIALIGFGVSQAATGLEKEQVARVYKDLYEQGLKDTVNDVDTDAVFGGDPPDDTIQWFHDNVSNLWFESSVNMNWRMGSTAGITDFINSPTGYDEEQNLQYCVDKVTSPDAENDDGKTYQGFAKAEIYEVNPDYRRRDRQKTFFHLGLEYDCCSDCLEDFPHRSYYSETAFQEELTDNYRTFLPNNYIDIEGNTGEITNVFRIQNNFYLHTEEALWHLPQSIQERVTGDIVSFIGTGSFFSIPPRLILDGENGSSAGSTHKWATIKTPLGVFFLSERQGVVYQFNGNSLNPISSMGLYNWFKENIKLKLDNQYYTSNRRPYPYRDNPSNRYGSGFISTYDSRKERIIITKKDSVFGTNVVGDNNDYEICVSGGDVTVFRNFNQLLAARANDGWNYEGIENCQLKFSRQTTETRPVEVGSVTTVPNEADIHIFYDTSGSFGDINDSCLVSIDTAIDDWVVSFRNSNPDWVGLLYKYEDTTEQWVNYPSIISQQTYGGITADKDIIVVSFCNEAAGGQGDGEYHNSSYQTLITNPTSTFLADYDNFVNNVYPAYNSFIGIHYPIVFGAESASCSPFTPSNLASSRTFLLHSVAALYGVPLTVNDLSIELPQRNLGFTVQEWDDLKQTLQGQNPYPNNGLRNFGWTGRWDRSADSQGNVINAQQFGEDINQLLGANSTTNTELVDVEFPTTEYDYVDGEVIVDPEMINNSWTISYSLKSNPPSWQSMHSYLPSFYINTPNRFGSWLHDSNFLWKHNSKNGYQNFYGQRYPFIIEYVSLSNPLSTRIFDYLKLITEAKKYNAQYNEFVDQKFITFNKGIFYNSNQSSGVLNLVVKNKNEDDEDYLLQQVQNIEGDSIIIDRNERDWSLNELRDYRTNYEIPMFDSNINSLQDNYYIDKKVNSDSIDHDKDWSELQSFRDKYLVVRLIFDTFDDVKLLLNYSVQNEKQSFR